MYFCNYATHIVLTTVRLVSTVGIDKKAYKQLGIFFSTDRECSLVSECVANEESFQFATTSPLFSCDTQLWDRVGFQLG